MRKELVLLATGTLMSFAALAQDEWNSTNNATSPMYRSGNVGIGISSAPTLPLVINSPSGTGTRAVFGGTSLLTNINPTDAALDIISPSGSVLGLYGGTPGSENTLQMLATGPYGVTIATGKRGGVGPYPDLNFLTNYGTTLKLQSDGRVVIGKNISTTPGVYKLYVEDGILTEKVKVAVKTTGNWSDHVFSPAYQLKSVEEVDAFIQKNKHLPGIPSAEEVVKDGLDLAAMDARLLAKIEEMMLYIIDLKKEVEQLKKENGSLKSSN